MRFLKIILSCILLVKYSQALDVNSPSRRIPQRNGDEPDYDDDDEDPKGAGRRTTTITRRPRSTITVTRERPTPTPGGNPNGPQQKCPQAWFDISKELSSLFLSRGVCVKDAHSSIRAVFHDCFPDGGCDGSLAIDEELSREANTPMIGTVNKLKAIARRYRVSNADMIAFAGSHAVVSCPGGPIVRTYVGRRDSNRPAPDGQLITAFAAGNSTLRAFRAKGFNAQDLAALIGAHTVSQQQITDPQRVGAAQDSTPGVWDSLYYIQTIRRTAPFTFASDSSLTQQEDVGPWMSQFANDKSNWDRVFTQAMTKLALRGTPGPQNMIDCTAALPGAH